MAQIKVLSDSASKLTLLYRDVGSKYICWFELKYDEKEVTRHIIGKQEMSLDDLNVLDYFSQLDLERNRLTIIILDGHSNQLLFFHASTHDYSQLPVLKRSVALNHLDNSVYNLNCHRASPTELKFNGMLLSPTRLHYITIANVAKSKISQYTWEVTDTRKFYNVLFATALDNTLNIKSLGDFQNFFIYQKDITTCSDPMLIRYSLRDPSYHHSSYALDLKPYKHVVAIIPGVSKSPDSNDVEEIEVYHLVNNSLQKLTLRTGEYTLSHPSPFSLDSKKLILHSSFFGNPNPSEVYFSFAERKTGKDEAKKQRNLKLVLIIVGIVVTSLFILIAVFALLVLLRDRKKIQLGTNQPADETEVDISYM